MISSLDPALVTDYYLLYQHAFKDYPVRVGMSLPGFEEFLREQQIDFLLSGQCHVYPGRLAGGLFMSIDPQPETIYNVLAAVAPPFRRQGILQALFADRLPVWMELGFRQCRLEVLSSNIIARHAYHKLDFVEGEERGVFRRTVPAPGLVKFLPSISFRTSTENADQRLEILDDGQVSGVCHIDLGKRKISQFTLMQTDARRDYAQWLLGKSLQWLGNGPVYFTDVAVDRTDRIEWLNRNGFELYIRQIEMKRALS